MRDWPDGDHNSRDVGDALVGAAENQSRGSEKGGDFGEGGEVTGGGTRSVLRLVRIFRERKGK